MQTIPHLFENDVKMYGTQTVKNRKEGIRRFENDVKMYGTQTICLRETSPSMFENDVKMYGTQTLNEKVAIHAGLRMM